MEIAEVLDIAGIREVDPGFALEVDPQHATRPAERRVVASVTTESTLRWRSREEVLVKQCYSVVACAELRIEDAGIE